jgi:hypothetical protein
MSWRNYNQRFQIKKRNKKTIRIYFPILNMFLENLLINNICYPHSKKICYPRILCLLGLRRIIFPTIIDLLITKECRNKKLCRNRVRSIIRNLCIAMNTWNYYNNKLHINKCSSSNISKETYKIIWALHIRQWWYRTIKIGIILT